MGQRPVFKLYEQIGHARVRIVRDFLDWETIQPMPQHRKCPVLVGFTSHGATRLIPCGQWSCKKCAKRLARRWAVRVRKHIENRPAKKKTKFYFVTLTLGSKYRNAEQGFAAIRLLWDRLRKRFQRTYPDWQYVAFVEGQPKRGGMPHFHIITSHAPPAKRNKKGEITRHNLHNWAVEMGWGHQAKLDMLTGSKAASYVAKYATKQHPSTPKGFRRVRASRDWTQLPSDPDRRLLVPARGEDIAHFILRVHEATNLPPEQIYNAWVEAQKMLALEQSKVDNP